MERKSIQSTEAVWRDRLVRFGKCSQTVKEFCRQEGVSVPSFYQWRKRLEKVQGQRGSKPSGRSSVGSTKAAKSRPFVPMMVSSSGGNAGSAISSDSAEVEFPNGVRIRVPAMNAEALRIAILAGNEACREVV